MEKARIIHGLKDKHRVGVISTETRALWCKMDGTHSNIHGSRNNLRIQGNAQNSVHRTMKGGA